MTPGEILGRYRVLEKLGEGGMGVVYRARDERLDRDVALKVLAADILSDKTAGKRFRQEARALSRLNHPNICGIYDFDSEQGVSFLAMEYVAGRTVADVAHAGPMAEGDLLPIALQLAEGLAAAHREGVVHRDLKPSNLALTADGRLKILDFGLAKLSEVASPDGVTVSVLETQGIAGTVPYMAPEQLRAAPVDARTDVYATGVVLYELATGRRPFDDATMPALTDSILHAVPISPGRLRPEITTAFEGIILRCLEKDPALRYQSAGDLLADLKRYVARSSSVAADVSPSSRPARRPVAKRWMLAAASILPLAAIGAMFAFNVFEVRDRLLGDASGQRIDSLAVLPLTNMSGDPNQEYFAAGMTEALTASVSNITTLRVIGRTSVMRFAGTRQSIPEIAAALHVDAVLEGSVLRDADRVRITVQLVAAHPERHLWANTYDRQLRDVLALHSEVAQAVAREIRTSLTPEQHGRLAASRPVNPAAHEEYLRGRRFFDRPAADGLQEAAAHFNKAIELDPSFAPAYSSVALLKMWSALLVADQPPRAVASEVRVAADKALELDPGSAEAMAVEGTLNLYFDWDWAMAERRLKRALELNPSDGTLYHPYADYLLVLGKPEESLEYTRRGAALDPLSAVSNGVVGGHLLFARHPAEAVSFLRRQVELNPDVRFLEIMLAGGLWQQGDAQAAIAEYRSAWNGSALYGLLERGYAEAGSRGAARSVAGALEAGSKEGWVNPLNIASWYARAGDTEATMRWLEKAYDERMPFLLHLRGDAEYDFIRADPRFVQLMKKIGFPE